MIEGSSTGREGEDDENGGVEGHKEKALGDALRKRRRTQTGDEYAGGTKRIVELVEERRPAWIGGSWRRGRLDWTGLGEEEGRGRGRGAQKSSELAAGRLRAQPASGLPSKKLERFAFAGLKDYGGRFRPAGGCDAMGGLARAWLHFPSATPKEGWCVGAGSAAAACTCRPAIRSRSLSL